MFNITFFKRTTEYAYGQQYGHAEVNDIPINRYQNYKQLDNLVIARVTDNIFNQAMDDINQYDYQALSLSLGYGERQPVLDFNKIKAPENIVKFMLGTNNNKEYTLDFQSYRHIFSKMTNLVFLEVQGIKNAHELLEFFPNLLFASCFYKTANLKMTNLEKHWPKLEVLSICNFKGDLSQFGHHSKLKFFQAVGYFSAESLTPLFQFPNLEGVYLNGARQAYDMRIFSKLPKLKKLLIVMSAMQDGWDEVVFGPDIQLVYSKVLPSLKILDNNPHLPSLITEKAGDLTKADLRKLGWVKRKAAFVDAREYKKDPNQETIRLHLLEKDMG